MSAENTLVDHLLSHVDVKHCICDFAGGYAAADLLARLSKEARPLTETYLRQVSHRGEFLRWQSLDDLEQDGIVSAANDAYLVARAVARRVAQLIAEEQNKFDAAYSDLDEIEARFATAATDVDDPLVLACGTEAKLATKPKKTSFTYEVRLLSACKWGDKDAVVKVPKSEIKPEFLLPVKDTINQSACGAIIGGGFKGTVSRASLEKYRQKLKELEAGIKTRCVVEVTYDDFQNDHEKFKALCEAAPTEAARLTYIAARAEEARMLPPEPIVERKKSRLGAAVAAIAKVAGGGYTRPNKPGTTERCCISDWAQAIADRAKAELAKRPVAERRAELVRRRRWAYSEPKNKAKRDALYEQIKARAPAIDLADYPFTPMDAAAHKAADDLWRRLWSAPEGRPGRNTVASHRFQLPLCRSFDLGHLADALRDGLSFLIPTSAIETPSPEQLVEKVEMGARRYPHFYPPARE